MTRLDSSAFCVVFPGNCVRMHRRASYAVVEDFEVKVSCFLRNDDIPEEDECRYKPPEALEVWVWLCVCLAFNIKLCFSLVCVCVCVRVCVCARVCAHMCTVHVRIYVCSAHTCAHLCVFCLSVAWW